MSAERPACENSAGLAERISGTPLRYKVDSLSSRSSTCTTMTTVKIHSKVAPKAQSEILTDGALQFLAALHNTFESTRQSLLAARQDAQRRWDSGLPLDFPPETAHIRAEQAWHCVPPAPGLEDRRVEITGPTDRKMVINALNSGAKTFMADFEGMVFASMKNLKLAPDRLQIQAHRLLPT